MMGTPRIVLLGLAVLAPGCVQPTESPSSELSGIEAHLDRQPMTYADLQRLHREPMNGNSDIWWVDAAFLEELRPTDGQGG